ncbi:iron complex transport system ATP-binding protein [Leucobacter luti]|uniref:Iron complex transport system ATP-binding protein n=1 Tax=Leucobacter luti TaxID=340320 RepID=A0A4R6S2Y1_9MICO|nr:ABC transporter ATP-binding protein [Leucobacter luti]TDP93417.1 iron complex transport system ATP-binding protein [Leucobacter luti]
MRVVAEDVTVEVDGIRIINDVTMDAPSGSVVALVGPNGSGKSTLLRAVYRSLRPAGGTIWIDGDDVWGLSARASSMRTAVVLQDDSPEFEFTVREVVALGRVPHRRAFERVSKADRVAIDEALTRAGVSELQDRTVATLSGGERQRVYLARALAQQTPVLVLDEPTNHLDLLAQTELLELLVDLPATVVIALHDLNLAATYSDRVVVLTRGRVAAAGPPETILTPELIEATYGVRAAVGTNAITGRRVLHFGPALRHRGQHHADASHAPAPSLNTESTPL